VDRQVPSPYPHHADPLGRPARPYPHGCRPGHRPPVSGGGRGGRGQRLPTPTARPRLGSGAAAGPAMGNGRRQRNGDTMVFEAGDSPRTSESAGTAESSGVGQVTARPAPGARAGAGVVAAAVVAAPARPARVRPAAVRRPAQQSKQHVRTPRPPAGGRTIESTAPTPGTYGGEEARGVETVAQRPRHARTGGTPSPRSRR